MMIHTETFINEIKQRPCIWDFTSEEYSNRELTRQAWVSMVQTLIADWNNLGKAEFEENIWQLQKKWKGLRDYFVRKKNILIEDQDDDTTIRKRKAPYLKMLQFLRAAYEPDGKPAPSREKREKAMRPKLVPAAVDFESDFSISSAEIDPFEKVEATPASSHKSHISEFQETSRHPVSIQGAYRETDPNMNFLLNILPDMKTMNERQNFEFRLEVMKLINKIKYGGEYCRSSSPERELVVKCE